MTIQAIKSLFCASDWQVTKKMMSARWIDVLSEKDLIPQDQQKEYANYFYSSLAEVLLNKMIFAQENHQRPASERIQDWDVISVAEKRATGYTVTEPDD